MKSILASMADNTITAAPLKNKVEIALKPQIDKLIIELKPLLGSIFKDAYQDASSYNNKAEVVVQVKGTAMNFQNEKTVKAALKKLGVTAKVASDAYGSDVFIYLSKNAFVGSSIPA